MTTRRERAQGLVFEYIREWDDNTIEIEWMIDRIESALADAERGVWEQAAQHAMTDSSGMLRGEIERLEVQVKGLTAELEEYRSLAGLVVMSGMRRTGR